MADTLAAAAQPESSPEVPSAEEPAATDSTISPDAAASPVAADAATLPEQPSDGQPTAGSELPGPEATELTAEATEPLEGEVSPEVTGSDTIAAIVASGISKTSIGMKTIGGKTFKRIGTELVPMVSPPLRECTACHTNT